MLPVYLVDYRNQVLYWILYLIYFTLNQTNPFKVKNQTYK
jgi:hypothetical protein